MLKSTGDIMRTILILLITLITYTVIELYSWKLIRAATRKGRWWKFWKSFYFISLGISLTALVSAVIFYRLQMTNSTLLINLMIGLFVSFLIAKLIVCTILLPYDLLSFGAKRVIALFSSGVHKTVKSPAATRRSFIIRSSMALASVPFGSFLFGITYGKYRFRVRNLSIYFEDLPTAFDGFRLAQISDLHLGSFDSGRAVNEGLELLQRQNPDLILFTGDLVNNFAAEIPPYAGMLNDLHAPFGKFSVLGNHDYGEYSTWPSEQAKARDHQDLCNYHAKMGFDLLKNERRYLQKDGNRICLAGVENWGTGHFVRRGDLEKTFTGAESGEFTLLMSHDPTHWDARILPHPKKIHLTMSGHTHGAQLGVEIPNVRWSPASYVYEQWAGLYKKKDQHLYVNRGFGFIGFPGRVGIWPEITLIELKKA